MRLRTQWASLALGASFHFTLGRPLETGSLRKRGERQVRPALLASSTVTIGRPLASSLLGVSVATYAFPRPKRVPRLNAAFFCQRVPFELCKLGTLRFRSRLWPGNTFVLVYSSSTPQPASLFDSTRFFEDSPYERLFLQMLTFCLQPASVTFRHSSGVRPTSRVCS